MERQRHEWIHLAALVATGALLVAATVALAALSSRFVYGSPLADRPLRTVVSVLMASGLVYLVAVYISTRLVPRGRWLALVLLLGLCMRAPLFFSRPIQEDDFYRYLWDGAVVAHGVNPYRFSPAEIRAGSAGQEPPAVLENLAGESGIVFDRINHPALATIYPPVAQAAFAVTHAAAPWSLTAWRFVIFLFDAATVAMLVLLLRTLNKPVHLAGIYWWNPVLLKEAYNSAHMDLVALPFALAALWFVLRSRHVRGACLLALAVGAKLWPVLLAPLLLRARYPGPKRACLAVVTGVVVVLLVMAPVLAAGPFDERSGFAAYGDRWEMNDALFMFFLKAARVLATAFGLGSEWADGFARGAVAAIVFALVAWLARRPIQDGATLANRIVIVLGVTFMLSPTQYPWYYLWIVPFLALSPRPSLLVLTAMLPIYYLKFYYSAQGNVWYFHNRIVWLEYAPTLLLAAAETLPVRRILALKPA